MSTPRQIYLFSCTGIEKPEGGIATEAIIKLKSQLPANSTIVSPASVCTNAGSIQSRLEGAPVIVIDGCSERCALKLTAKYHGKVIGRLLVTKYMQQNQFDENTLSSVILSKIQQDILELIQNAPKS